MPLVFPWIVAHRGAMAEAPENTISAFDRALHHGADGIEFDVQASRDGVPVIFHDQRLKKINRSNQPVCAYAYAALSKMDWGAWFSKDFRGEPIPALEAVLSRYAGKTRLLAEIKPVAPDECSLSGEKLAERVTESIRANVPEKFLDQVMILSFNAAILEAAARQTPELTYGQNLETDRLELQALPACVKAVSLPFRKMTERFAVRCHERGLRVMTYSCNSPNQAKKAMHMGVDVIMTDDPGRVCPYIQQN